MRFSKLYSFSAVLLCLLIIGACGSKLVGFDMVYKQYFPRVIPAGASTIESQNFIIENIPSNALGFYAQNNAKDGDIIKIIPKFGRISAKFNDGDFIFVNRVFVYIYPTGQPGKKTEVFYRDDIPVNTGSIINLNPGIANVKEIVSSERYTMEIRLDLRGQPGTNIEALIDYSFFAVTDE